MISILILRETEEKDTNWWELACFNRLNTAILKTQPDVCLSPIRFKPRLPKILFIGGVGPPVFL